MKYKYKITVEREFEAGESEVIYEQRVGASNEKKVVEYMSKAVDDMSKD